MDQLTLLLSLFAATVLLAPVAERTSVPYPVLLLTFCAPEGTVAWECALEPRRRTEERYSDVGPQQDSLRAPHEIED